MTSGHYFCVTKEHDLWWLKDSSCAMPFWLDDNRATRLFNSVLRQHNRFTIFYLKELQPPLPATDGMDLSKPLGHFFKEIYNPTMDFMWWLDLCPSVYPFFLVDNLCLMVIGGSLVEKTLSTIIEDVEPVPLDSSINPITSWSSLLVAKESGKFKPDGQSDFFSGEKFAKKFKEKLESSQVLVRDTSCQESESGSRDAMADVEGSDEKEVGEDVESCDGVDKDDDGNGEERDDSSDLDAMGFIDDDVIDCDMFSQPMTTSMAAINVLLHPFLPFSEEDLFWLKPLKRKVIAQKFGWEDKFLGVTFGRRGEKLVSVGRVLSAMTSCLGVGNYTVEPSEDFTGLATISKEGGKTVKYLVLGVLNRFLKCPKHFGMDDCVKYVHVMEEEELETEFDLDYMDVIVIDPQLQCFFSTNFRSRLSNSIMPKPTSWLRIQSDGSLRMDGYFQEIKVVLKVCIDNGAIKHCK